MNEQNGNEVTGNEMNGNEMEGKKMVETNNKKRHVVNGSIAVGTLGGAAAATAGVAALVSVPSAAAISGVGAAVAGRQCGRGHYWQWNRPGDRWNGHCGNDPDGDWRRSRRFGARVNRGGNCHGAGNLHGSGVGAAGCNHWWRSGYRGWNDWGLPRLPEAAAAQARKNS